ncbi:DUF6086 family protein [Streptomyces sp. NPDC059629]|uniref:DUF6086 family protein n=1 Tax=Streptomyces sp. NPDC059629 TaxID=3346889 RepID=UPI0036C97B6B
MTRPTSHAVTLTLSEGFTATVLVLAGRAGIGVDWAQFEAAPEGPFADVQAFVGTGMSAPAEGRAWGAGLREKAQEIARHMAR